MTNEYTPCGATQVSRRTSLGAIVVTCFKLAGHEGQHAGMLPASWVSWEATAVAGAIEPTGSLSGEVTGSITPSSSGE